MRRLGRKMLEILHLSCAARLLNDLVYGSDRDKRDTARADQPTQQLRPRWVHVVSVVRGAIPNDGKHNDELKCGQSTKI